MRRTLIQRILPLIFCLVPLLSGVLVAVCLPAHARTFYLDNLSLLDGLILSLGAFLFLTQSLLGWVAMQWRTTGFDERPDKWLTSLAQAAEWFPLLGLLGTVAGILQTFSAVTPQVQQAEIIRLYAPAITATGSGLFMALINILPTWVVMVGRDLISSLGAPVAAAPGTAKPLQAEPPITPL